MKLGQWSGIRDAAFVPSIGMSHPFGNRFAVAMAASGLRTRPGRNGSEKQRSSG
jgi:hypothetical protein